MENLKLKRHNNGPEAKIQKAIMDMLKIRDWYVKVTHGSVYQSGLPDLFACHKHYGHRWVEVKDPERQGDVFTPAQHETFPKLCAYGSGVWVLVAATEHEYEKLSKAPNWYTYLHHMRPT